MNQIIFNRVQPKPNLTQVRKGNVAVFLIFFNYAQAGLGFFVNLWLARELGAAEYGLLSYGLVVAGICKIVVGFASERTLVRDLVHSTDNYAMMTSSVVLRLTMAFLTILGCVVWALTSKTLGAKAIPMVLCSLWGSMMALTPRAWLDLQYKMHINAAITLVEKCMYVACIAVLITQGLEGSGAIWAASCLVATRCLGLASEWAYALRTFGPSFSSIKTNINFLIRQNGLILGAALANLLMTHLNQIALEKHKGLENLAFYSVAFQIITMVSMAQSQFVRLLAPQTAELTRPERTCSNIRTQLLRYVMYSAIATAIFVIPLGALCPVAIKLLLPQEYIAAVKPLRVLCLWSLLYGPALVTNQFLLGLRLKRYYFCTTLVSGSIAVLLGQELVPRYGGVGVALSLLLAHATSIAIQFTGVWVTLGRLSTEKIQEEEPKN